jgi:hypothetical protein
LIVPSKAHADWTITTYKQIPGNPEINTIEQADQYFTGARPTRFVGTGTVTQVDLAEGTGGQFAINNPFPGLDNLPAVGDTNDYTARITGTLVVNTAGSYNFFTDSDDGNRFRLDLNRNGTFEDATESIVPNGGLQGAGTPERSGEINLMTGNYPFEVTFFERGGGANIEGGYRQTGMTTQYVLGNAAGGISLLAPAQVRVVGAQTDPVLSNFAQADALRTSIFNQTGFPVTEVRDVFNIHDSGGDADFPNGQGPPGLGAAGATDDDDFLVVGRGVLVVPAGGITGAIFRSNTDDGGRLLIDTNNDLDLNDLTDRVIFQNVLQGPTNTNSAPVTLAAGRYLIEYSWFERGGGGEGEVSVSLGGGPFRLLGENASVAAGTSLEVANVPEPATTLLVGMFLVGGAGVMRRRK